MKIFLNLKQNMMKALFFILVIASSLTSAARASSGGTPIVKLSSFTAMLNNKSKVDLKWSTEIETNLSHIMVEKSTDGKNFKDAALVFTYGNTTAKSDYSFADNITKIKSGSIYYRLRSVAVDGTTQYSATCIVTISK